MFESTESYFSNDEEKENPFESKEIEESTKTDNEIDLENKDDTPEKLSERFLNISSNLINNLKNPRDFIKEIFKKSSEDETLESTIAERNAALDLARETQGLIRTLENKIIEAKKIQEEIKNINKDKENLHIIVKEDYRDRFDKLLDNTSNSDLLDTMSELFERDLNPEDILSRAETEFGKGKFSDNYEDENDNKDSYSHHFINNESDKNKVKEFIDLLESMKNQYNESSENLESDAFNLMNKKSEMLSPNIENDIERLKDIANEQNSKASELSIAVNNLIQKIEASNVN